MTSAARRSSSCRTATTRRAWSSTTRCWIWPSGPRRRSTRSACAHPRGGRRDFKEAEFVLRQLSQETGGRVFFPTNVGELPKIYDQISEELASQYTLAYTSKNPLRNGAWRRIVVRLTASGRGRPHPAGLLRAWRHPLTGDAVPAPGVLRGRGAGVRDALRAPRRRARAAPRPRSSPPASSRTRS